MTFADVPMGHIFRVPWCDCVYRRENAMDVTLVTACEAHKRGAVGHLSFLSGLHVKYDPFVAQLEAESKEQGQ